MNKTWSVKELARFGGRAQPPFRGRRPVAAGLLAVPLLTAAAAAATGDPDPFDAARALAHVEVLAGRIGPRPAGSPAEASARDYISSALRQAGFDVSRSAVSRVGDAWVGSENIIGTLAGRTESVLLIGAHHDTSADDVPGANDDASGVGVALEVARVLAARRPDSTIRIATFCAEEEGLLGSRHHAMREDPSRLRAVINLDMVGRGPIAPASIPFAPPLWAARAIAASAREAGIDRVRIDPRELLVSRARTGPFGADHEPFAARDVPAFTLSGRFEPWTHHTPQDVVSRIDLASLQAAGRLALALVRRFDASPPRLAGAGDAGPAYTVVSVRGRPFFVTPAAVAALALVTASLAALWWRSLWWRASRRGRRLTASDAGRAAVRCGAPLAGLLAGVALSEMLGGQSGGPDGSASPGFSAGAARCLLLAAAGLVSGWTLSRGTLRPHEDEIHTVLGAGWAALLGFALVSAGRPDAAFYFLLPAALALAASLPAPALAGVGGLLGFLPMIGLFLPGAFGGTAGLAGRFPASAWFLPLAWVAFMPLSLLVARTPGSFRPAGWRWAGLLAAAGALMALQGARHAPDPDAAPRVIRLVETIDATDRAKVSVSSDGLLRGIRTSLAGRPRIDSGARRIRFDAAVPRGLIDPALLTVRLDPVEAMDPREDRVLRDLRMLLLAPLPAAGARFTIRSREAFDVFDGGVWVSRSRQSRRHAFAAGTYSDALRVRGSPGQVLDVEARLLAHRDVLGLGLSAPGTLVRAEATLVWRGRVVL